MARKDLMKGLMPPAPSDGADAADTAAKGPSSGPKAPALTADRPAAARPRYAKGAIGAVGQSIAHLKSRSVVEIDPHLIDAGGLTDRLDHDIDSHAALKTSLRDYGQQVPILVRPHPQQQGRYQIVYGRRRVLALRDLGQDAKAMVRDLDDSALIMAQGQENTARRDLTFIEKANFARQMRDAGYDRKAMCDALNIDKTLISRMLSITDRVGVEVIEAVGAANGIGRDRWADLADRMETLRIDPGQVVGAIAALAKGATGADRFEAALAAVAGGFGRIDAKLARPTPAPVQRHAVTDAKGQRIARVTRRDGGVQIALPRDGFDDWLVDRLADLHAEWLNGPGSTGD